MFLIVGLGNPGRKYALTRHNIGFEVIDYMIDKYRLINGKMKFKGEHYTHLINRKKIIFLKPHTYMNLSGECVKAYVDYFDIPLQNIMIIYDDTSFEPGFLRVRKTGSAGGHNGMDDILRLLGTNDIARIRIGIGSPKFEIKDYVLSRFTAEEIPIMQKAVINAADAIKLFIENDIDQAMNIINRKNKKQETTTENNDE
jgi:PTH1 family peptidyl-tRNA hydrolase